MQDSKKLKKLAEFEETLKNEDFLVIEFYFDLCCGAVHAKGFFFLSKVYSLMN